MGFSRRVRTGGLPDTQLAGRGGLSGGPGAAVAALSLMLLSGVSSSWASASLRHCWLGTPSTYPIHLAVRDPFRAARDPTLSLSTTMHLTELDFHGKETPRCLFF